MADIAYAPRTHGATIAPKFLGALNRLVSSLQLPHTGSALRSASPAHLRDLGLGTDALKRSYWGERVAMNVLYPGR